MPIDANKHIELTISIPNPHTDAIAAIKAIRFILQKDLKASKAIIDEYKDITSHIKNEIITSHITLTLYITLETYGLLMYNCKEGHESVDFDIVSSILRDASHGYLSLRGSHS